MAKEPGPQWLPASAAEARLLAYWGQWFAFLFGILFLVIGVIGVIFWWVWGFPFYLLIAGVLNLIAALMLKTSFFDSLDAGRFKEASERLIIWTVLTLIFGVVAGIFLILSWVKLGEVFQPNYQPYPAGQYQAGAPQGAAQPQAPPTAPPAPAPQAPPQPAPQPTPEQPKHTEMVKCKKCGVQYPAFMRTCPNCNEPR